MRTSTTCLLKPWKPEKNEHRLSRDLARCVFQIIHQTGSDCLPSLVASNRLLEERGGGLDREKEVDRGI